MSGLAPTGIGTTRQREREREFPERLQHPLRFEIGLAARPATIVPPRPSFSPNALCLGLGRHSLDNEFSPSNPRRFGTFAPFPPYQAGDLAFP